MDGSIPATRPGSAEAAVASYCHPVEAALVTKLCLVTAEPYQSHVAEDDSVPSWGHKRGPNGNQDSVASKKRRPDSAPASRRARLSSKPRSGQRLTPSSAPTPRHPGLAGSYQVRPAQILAPSSGSCNDEARAHNLGCRLGRLFDVENASPIVNLNIPRSSSAPAISQPVTKSRSSEDDPKTPRTQRGYVRRVSKVIVHRPELPQALPESAAKKMRRPASAVTLRVHAPSAEGISKKVVPFRGQAAPKRLKRAKSVTWEDKSSVSPVSPASPSATEEEPLSPARRRSSQLLSSLSALRRVTAEQAAISRERLAAAGDATEHPQSGEEQAIAAKPRTSTRKSLQEQEDGLMHATLGDLHDDEPSLLRLCNSISGLQDPISARGGARHATSAIFNRILSVVKRKAELLHELEKRKAAIEAAHAGREELLRRVLLGEAGPPLELVGLHKFVAAHTHRGGNPADANMCDFDTFAASFGLPSKHQLIIALRSLCDEVLNWWIDATLREAEQGSSFESVRRVMAVAISSGASRTHGTLIKSIKTVENRLADKVLADAQEAFECDELEAKKAESTGSPPVGQAEAAASKIREAIKGVIAQRVPASHPSLTQAQKIIQELEQRESERGFIASRLKRRSTAKSNRSSMESPSALLDGGRGQSCQVVLTGREAQSVLSMGSTR